MFYRKWCESPLRLCVQEVQTDVASVSDPWISLTARITHGVDIFSKAFFLVKIINLIAENWLNKKPSQSKKIRIFSRFLTTNTFSHLIFKTISQKRSAKSQKLTE